MNLSSRHPINFTAKVNGKKDQKIQGKKGKEKSEKKLNRFVQWCIKRF